MTGIEIAAGYIVDPAAVERGRFCRDCMVDCLAIGASYMVHDEVWAAAGLAYADGVLCFACLRRRLGRPLRLADFPVDRPINHEHRKEILRACRGRRSANRNRVPVRP